jgi:hypothetical protein
MAVFSTRHEIREQAKPLNECTLAHQRINFDNICEIIQTSDGFSRHLELWPYKLVKTTYNLGGLIDFIYESGPPHWKTVEFRVSAEKSHVCPH